MAGNRISAGIELGGEKEFKSAISSIKDDMKVLSSEAKLLTEQYKDNDNSLEVLTKQTENYDKQADKQKEKIDLLEKALKNAEEQYGKNSSQAKKWETQLNNERTALIKTERAISDNKKEIEKLEKSTRGIKGEFDTWKKKTDELKEKHEALYKGMKKVGDTAGSLAKGGLKALGAAATGAVAGVAAIGAAAVSAGKKLGELIVQAGEAGDAIDKGSQKIGVSAEQYQILSYQAELSGTSIETLSTAAAKLKKAGSDMDVDEAVKKLAAIKDPAERSAAAVEMFGAKTAQELTPMLNAGTEGLKEMEEAARNMGMVMSNDSVEAAAKFQDSLTSFQTSTEAIKNNLVADFLPGATEVLNGITGLLAGDEGAAEKIKNGVSDMIENFESMIPQAIEIFKMLGQAAVEAAPEIISSLATGLIDNLPDIVDSAIQMIDTLVNGLLTPENIEKIMTSAVTLIKQLVRFLSENIDLLIGSAFEIIMSLVEGLTDPEIIHNLVKASIDMIGELATGLIENLPDLIVAAVELVGALANELLTYDWWGLAKKVFASLKDAFKRLFTGKDEPETSNDSRSKNGSHAAGLEYVPYDGYTAELHKGERVLTAYESQTYSTNSEATADEVRGLRSELSAMRSDMRRYGMPVNVENWRQGRRELRV